MKSGIYIKILIAGLLLLHVRGVNAQDFTGYLSGNYSGPNSMLLQPAEIVDRHFKFDKNFFSFSHCFDNTFVDLNRSSFFARNVFIGLPTIFRILRHKI